jgi:hypothetical protein
MPSTVLRRYCAVKTSQVSGIGHPTVRRSLVRTGSLHYFNRSG